MTPLQVYIGWDPSQMRAWRVAEFSLKTHASVDVYIRRVAMAQLRSEGLYTRPTREMEHGYWDEISDAPMSTGHAIARFLIVHLMKYSGWGLFVDGDVLFRDDVAKLFALADPTKAVQVVQHAHDPREAVKMTGEAQTRYQRKNWSSCMLIHAGHPANRALTVDLVNTVPGRDLHRFCWLDDDLIGTLDPRWNWLVGHSAPDPDPALVHFTDGYPSLPGYEHVAFADEWYDTARAAGYRLTQPPVSREGAA